MYRIPLQNIALKMRQNLNIKSISVKQLIAFYPKMFEEIKRFYPLDLRKDQEEYQHFPGIKEINRIIQDNILNENNFRSRWDEGFHSDLAKALQVDVKGATGGLVPCTGGIIHLGEDHLGYPIEFNYYVSLLNDFYSIQIVEKGSSLHFEKRYAPNSSGTGTKRIIVSPIPGPYQSLFTEVENYLIANLENPVFIPFVFDTLQLENFQVSYKDCTAEGCFISDAFFHKLFNVQFNTEIVGEINYKIGALKNI